jgi:hypothetical protein
MWLVGLVFAAWGGSPGSPPAAIQVSAEEASRLAAREVVVRPSSAGGGQTVAIADCRATPAEVIAAVVDVEARRGEVGAITDVQVYDRQPDTVGARFTITVVGSDTVFHVRYDVDAAGGYTKYHLDPTKPNDLTQSDGSYQAYVLGDVTRLVFRTTVDNGGWVPGWVKEKLTAGPLVDQINGIRARAEK